MDPDNLRSPGEPPPAPAATPLSPKPTAFTVDFGESKAFDMSRFEQLMKKSQARHQRVHSMSASWHRPSPSPSSSPAPPARRLPMSAKLPRKTPGYHSEGYFSSDQEESGIGYARRRRSPARPDSLWSPGNRTNEKCECGKRNSIDGFQRSSLSRKSLMLPLDTDRGKRIPEKSPGEASLLADTSSPELELMTPDGNGEQEDGKVSPSSTISEAGTYTIEADNYTEEQKAKMNIDKIFGMDDICAPLMEAIEDLRKRSPRKEEPRESFDLGIRRELLLAKNVPDSARKTSAEKNVLEVTYCYQSPTEPTEPAKIGKHPKSAGSYLDKIKNRVKNIGERTFQKKQPREDPVSTDYGSFTSVTASGVLSLGKKTPFTEDRTLLDMIAKKNNLSKSQTDSNEYVHQRQELVVQNVIDENIPPRLEPLEGSYRPEYDDLADKADRDLVTKISYISLNRCQGDKSWIQEWANQVKQHNKELNKSSKPDLALIGLPPTSPRHTAAVKGVTGRSPSTCSTPSKIPSPVGTLTRHRTNIPDILSSTPDTQSYLLNTQNAISSLQAKLQNAKSTSPNVDLDYIQNLHSDYPTSKLPISQLSRSNSLNYRLHRKGNSLENSPLRNPSRYQITGNCTMPASARILLANLVASKSLETENGIAKNQYSPLHSKYYSKPERKISLSSLKMTPNEFQSPDEYRDSFDLNNANMTQSLNIDYRNRNRDNSNEFESLKSQGRRSIDQTGGMYLSNSSVNGTRGYHQRVASDSANIRQINKRIHQNIARVESTESPIKRSSSFNVVNRNIDGRKLTVSPRLNALRKQRPADQRFKGSGDSGGRNNTPECDYLSEDSDNLSTGGFYSDFDRKTSRKESDIMLGTRYNRAFALRRARIESPDSKHNAPANSPRYPGTPEARRKLSSQSDHRLRTQFTRDSRSVSRQPEVKNDKKTTKPTVNNTNNRMTRSSSTTKEFSSKQNDKNKKIAQAKEAELANWKKRATYDPIKAAIEGKKRMNQSMISQSGSKNSNPTSSPVHRSRSFNCTGAMIEMDLEKNDVDISSDTDDQDERLICTLSSDKNSSPIFNIVSGKERNVESLDYNVNRRSNNPNQNTRMKISNEYVTKIQVSDSHKKPSVVDRLRGSGKFDSLDLRTRRSANLIDSDTATVSTTNGSGGSRRNSSVGSDEKAIHRDIGLSDSPIDSDAEPVVNVVMRAKRSSVPLQNRHSGDFSMTSSTTTSTSKDVLNSANRKPIQPRYLDISKYKSNEPSPAKNFLRRDPSKTYVNVLPSTEHRQQNKKTIAKLEQEAKTKELEKWKRRASYDPRKAAAEGKIKVSVTKSPSNSVLRSQSFHGPMTQSKLSTARDSGNATFFSMDLSSDNEF